MRIAIICNHFSENIGGAIGVAYLQANELEKINHEVFIFTGGQEDNFGWVTVNNIRVYKVKVKKIRYILRSYLSLFNFRINKEFKKFLKETSPDIVHFQNIYYHLPFSLFKITKKYMGKVFYTIHDVMPIHYGKFIPKNEDYIRKINTVDQIKEAGKSYNPFRNIVIRHYLKYADKIFTVSHSAKQLLEINGIKNVNVIYNGINITDWKVEKSEINQFKDKYKLNKKRIIIFVGRLIEAKGGDELIKALSLVNKTFPDFILLIVGKNWAYTDKLKKMARDLKISEKIIFTDLLTKEELKVAYHSADISVCPSLCFETFGMTNLEAMACKKPVISTIFGGPKEVVIDGETGYLVNPNNVELMAEKIIDLLKNPEKARKFGEAGYERAKQLFPLERQIRELLRQYKTNV